MQLFIYQLHKYGTKKLCDLWGSLKQGEHSHFLKMSNLRKYNLYSFLVEAVKGLFEMNKAATDHFGREQGLLSFTYSFPSTDLRTKIFWFFWMSNTSLLTVLKYIFLNTSMFSQQTIFLHFCFSIQYTYLANCSAV